MRNVLRAVLVLIAAATLFHAGPASGAPTTSLGGYAGSGAASGVHVFYNPEGVLPLPPPVDIGSPDALASIASGPSTLARASVADPGDLLANPDALLSLAGFPGYKPGTVPPYPYRVTASSSTGEADNESSPAPGLDARVHADQAGSSAQATMPGTVAPAIAAFGSVSSSATSTLDAATVTVHGHAEVSDFDLLGIVKIESIVTDLTASSTGAGVPTLTGGTVVSGATVMGQPVTIDGDGVHRTSDSSSPETPLNAIVGGVTGTLAGNLNNVLANAGIHITLAGPVQQTGGSSGQLGSDGLRIDITFSDETIPGLTSMLDGLPPLPNPIPGAPSAEDLLQVARANNLVAVQLARGVVTLAARPPASVPISNAPGATAPGASFVAPTFGAASAPPASTGPIASGSAGVVVPLSSGDGPAPLATGIGALALLALLVQPFIGDWLGRGSAAVLSSDQFTACPWEER